MSLRSTLNEIIRQQGYLSYGEVARIAAEEGYKLSNAERRLRRSESPYVKPIEGVSKRGTKYIVGYEYDPPEKKKEPLKVDPKPLFETPKRFTYI